MVLTFELIGKFILAGGGLAAIAFGIFKFFGVKWLEAKFGERMQNLKARQDETIRYVQSSIDREVHRAKKLYDGEFTALAENWRLLRAAFDSSVGTIASWNAQVDMYTDVELDRLLTKRGMEDWLKAEIIAKKGKDRLDAYRRWSEYERYKGIDKEWRDFHAHLGVNCIFLREGFTERFRAIERLIIASNVEFEDRVASIGVSSARVGFDATNKLRTEGTPLTNELEKLVRDRLWSASTASDSTP